MKVLLIDAGNTRVKFGCHDGAAWRMQQAVTSMDAIVIPDDFAADAVLVSNVAGDQLAAALKQRLQALTSAVPKLFRSSAQCAALRNAYDIPQQLGADRFAAAIGAWAWVGDTCLVVSAGTATTLDVVQAPGVFAGGCIMPGLALMAQSLQSGTAQLKASAGQHRALPRNTADAIYSGCLNAHLGAIEQGLRTLPADTPIVLTGGAASELLPLLSHRKVVHKPWLVLDGLLQVARTGCTADLDSL